jgi:hypothetical protein
MDPATIALIFQVLDLAIKEAPEVMILVQELKTALNKNQSVQGTLKQITDGTIQVSNDTLAILAPLLKKAA